MTTLLDAVRRHAEVHADREGIAPTPIQGVFAVRATATGDLKHDISRPLLCLVVQGAKRVTMGTQSFDFSDGDSLLITWGSTMVHPASRAAHAIALGSASLPSGT